MTAPVPDPTLREAEALLALEPTTYEHTIRNESAWARFRNELIRIGPAVIRALMERVEAYSQKQCVEWNANQDDRDVLEARIAALEAEVEAFRTSRAILAQEKETLEAEKKRVVEQAQIELAALEAKIELLAELYQGMLDMVPRSLRGAYHYPTPAEIAARVAQNRKEQNG